MKKNIVKILIPIFIIVLSFGLFVGCKNHEEDGKKDEITSNGITAEVTEALLIKGESFTLGYEFDPKEARKEVEFSSDNDNVTVDKDGKITAAKTGSSIVTVKEKDGDKYAQCKIYIGDIIVDASAKEPTTPTFGDGSVSLSKDTVKLLSQSNEATDGNQEDSDSGEQNNGEQNDTNNDVVKNYGGVYGTSLFKTVQEGINGAKENNTILIKSGSYSETVNVTKSVTLFGVEKPQIKGVEINENLTVTLNGLNIVDSEYPAGTSARVLVNGGCTLKMENCMLSTDSKEALSGGYGVLVEKQARKVDISNNTISNLRYGIYVCPTDGEINIKNNTFSNLEVGTGVDVRQENSEVNYPTTGEINMNTYNEVLSDTQFLHYGENYNGDLDFKDNEKDNASTDEGNNGGSGINE